MISEKFHKYRKCPALLSCSPQHHKTEARSLLRLVHPLHDGLGPLLPLRPVPIREEDCFVLANQRRVFFFVLSNQRRLFFVLALEKSILLSWPIREEYCFCFIQTKKSFFILAHQRRVLFCLGQLEKSMFLFWPKSIFLFWPIREEYFFVLANQRRAFKILPVSPQVFCVFQHLLQRKPKVTSLA